MNIDDARIEHLVISPAHNYVGHFGREPGDAPAVSVDEARLIAGRGIEGDRYAERPAGHDKQITFFDMAALDALREVFGPDVPPSAVRRNVFTRGIDLNALVGVQFRLQGVLFEGAALCHPCFWMDEAIGPGAEALLKNRGGLRARILEDGVLRRDTATPSA